ncbi:hypothetical protein AAIO99_33265, partial [Streptomyces sp. AC154]
PRREPEPYPEPEPSARPDREPYRDRSREPYRDRDRDREPYDPLAEDPDDDVAGGGSWRTPPQDRTDRPAPWDKDRDSRGRSTHRDHDDDNDRYRRGFLDGDAE